MQILSRQGLEIELPDGWDARIYRREAVDDAITRRALHAANFALPTNLGDYAVGAVERMTAGDVLVVLLEFDPDSAGQGLFKNEGLPSGLTAGDFSPTAMPAPCPGARRHSGSSPSTTGRSASTSSLGATPSGPG